MKRVIVLFFIMLLVPSFALAKADKSQMMKGAKLSQTQPELPTVVIGGNTVVGNIARPGWPIIISAAMDSDADPAPEVPSNLNVKLVDQNGDDVPVTFEPVQRPDNTQRFWIAFETATGNLTPGQYTITLEIVQGLEVVPGDLEVQADSDGSSSLDLLKIQQLLLTGKYDEALAQADGMTAKDPGNLDAWIAKGDMLMAQDLPDQASDAYEKAFELGRPSIYLQERMSRALRRSLEKRGVIPSTENKTP